MKEMNVGERYEFRRMRWVWRDL